jgi:uncharacterized protein YecE (DUF72 family)
VAEAVPGEGSHLERYARVLHCAEINSSFHRPHAVTVYARWAAATPPSFRFAVKLPRAITHEGELRRASRPLDAFMAQVAGLGPKLGPLLVQLPPSQVFNARVSRAFFAALRDRHAGAIVCEPRHPSWFEGIAERLLEKFEVARVATDPSRIAAAHTPGGWAGLVYYRLHGSPRKYWSRYPPDRVQQWARELALHAKCADAWCIFDNTASGAAMANALELRGLVVGP